MKKMIVKFTDGKELKIRLCEERAPETINALEESLPQLVKYLHARFNGEAIFFKADFVEGELPVENAKPGAEMKAGEVSMWRGGAGFGSKAMHFWYGPKVAGGTTENVIGEIESDLKVLNDLGVEIWLDGPDKALVSIIEE